MDNVWSEYLRRQSAVIEDDVITGFGDQAAELAAAKDGDVLCALCHLGLIRVSGEESQTYLQNLLSCDIRETSSGKTLLGSLNTAKGRTQAIFQVIKQGEDYLLVLPRTLLAPILKRLSLFVLRSKVRLSDATGEVALFGLSGPQATSLLEAQLGTAPEVGHVAGKTIRLADSRYQILCAPDEAIPLWQALSQTARPAGSTTWDWLDIQAGIPVVMPATQEEFVPQMTNLELVGGVSFKKGCYPGQEIVARMHYLGKPKRRMFLAHVTNGQFPRPGDKLHSDDNLTEGQSTGIVVNAAPSPEGGYDLLAVVHISSHDHHTVHLGAPDGATLDFRPLPYALPA
jgi:folate-binding protein YgfZ